MLEGSQHERFRKMKVNYVYLTFYNSHISFQEKCITIKVIDANTNLLQSLNGKFNEKLRLIKYLLINQKINTKRNRNKSNFSRIHQNIENSIFSVLHRLRGQPLGVPGEHGSLPDVVQAKVEHAHSLLKMKRKSIMKNEF